MIWEEEWEEEALPPVTPYGFHTNPCSFASFQDANLCLFILEIGIVPFFP